MASDQQNPFTMMGMMQMMQPNKYINPAYKDKPLPIPGFLGTPTDAQGNPIQSFTDAQAAHDAWQPPAAAAPPPGTTTLNAAPSFKPGSVQDPAWQARSNPGPSAYYAQGSSGSLGGNQYDSARIPMTPFAQAPVGPGQRPGPAPAAAAPQNPIDMRQAYLTALSNPGKVTTPGATIQPSAPIGQPNVLDAFLKNRQAGPAAPAAGGYSNKPFFDTLSQLRSNA